MIQGITYLLAPLLKRLERIVPCILNLAADLLLEILLVDLDEVLEPIQLSLARRSVGTGRPGDLLGDLGRLDRGLGYCIRRVGK